MDRWFTNTRCRILVSEDTYSLLEAQAPEGDMPPLHVHADHDEIFYVQSGRMTLHLPGSRIEVGPGEAAFGPRGVPHTYRVDSAEGARWLVASGSIGSRGPARWTSPPSSARRCSRAARATASPRGWR